MPNLSHHQVKIFELFKYINESSKNSDFRKVWGAGGHTSHAPLSKRPWKCPIIIAALLRILFLKYGFIRKIEPFHLKMKHNIIEMTATAGLRVAHLINPISQYIFDCLGFNPINRNFDFVFQGLNLLWMVSVTLILNGSPQKIVSWGAVELCWFKKISWARMVKILVRDLLRIHSMRVYV